MARTRVNKTQKYISPKKNFLVLENGKENNTKDKNIKTNTPPTMEHEIGKKRTYKKPSKIEVFNDFPIDVEAFLRGEISSIEEITNKDDLYKAKDLYKKTVRRVLNTKRKEILNETRKKRLMLLEEIPEDVKRMPFICLLIGLKNNYVGEKITSKRKIDSVKKKPSIIVKIEDQTITIEGSDVKIEGRGKKAYNNKFINEIKNLYDNYYGGNRKK